MCGLTLAAVADETKVIDVISRLLHPSVAGVLAAFLPGLFFETCVMIARPQIAQLVVARASLLYRYTPVLVALLVAFVVGSAFMLWVQLIQYVVRKSLGKLGRLGLWDSLVQWLASRAVRGHAARVVAPGQRPPAPSWYFRFVQRLQYRKEEQDREWRQTCDAWEDVATVLLKRYGVENRGHSLRPWTSILGTLRVEELRGYTLVTALHATGWSGLAAAHFAPELRIVPFEVLCLFLIFCGLFGDLSLALHSSHLLGSWLMGLGNTWDELKKTGISKSAETSEKSD